MPKEAHIPTGPRQRPISCRFCRARKLRCSREAPCSNCVSRGIQCESAGPGGKYSQAGASSESKLLEHICNLEERLERLNRHQKQSAQATHTPQTLDDYNAQERSQEAQPQMEQLDKDVAWLESIYNGPDRAQNTIPSNRVVFKICPIHQIMDTPQYIDQGRGDYWNNCGASRCIWLPQFSEAKILLEKFVQDVEHIAHIHTPKLPSILSEVYACLNQQGHVKSGDMILLLSIFTSASYVWKQKDSCKRGLFSTATEANRQAPFWIKATEDVLDIAHRTTRITIEGIQGIIIASFISANLDGFLRRFRFLKNIAIMLARELGLHCIDHPSHAKSADSPQAEIGRRVWWYLVGSDWAMAARFNGISQGVYQCHPRHMMTNKPLNLDDDDLVDGMSRIGRPICQPTAMSYSLQRIRLAEISRNIVDRSPLMLANAGGPSYDVIMDIDTELQQLLNDLPTFFSMSAADITATYGVDSTMAVTLVRQGHMFHSLFYAQRCKLHLPYVGRGFLRPEFAASRDICIQSARLIIQTEAAMERSGLCNTARYTYLGLLVSVTMASIVLLMDLCQNKSAPYCESQRGEIAQAFRMLEAAKHESATAAKFLDSLIHVLHKHKIAPPKCATRLPLEPTLSTSIIPDITGSQACGDPANGLSPLSAINTLESNGIETATNTTHDSLETKEDWSYLDELVQDIEQGTDFGSFDWDNVFLGIDDTTFI